MTHFNPTYSIQIVGSSIPRQLSDPNVWERHMPRLLDGIGRTAVNKIRLRMSSGIFKESTGKGIQAIKMRIEQNAVVVYADEGIAPYLKFVERGVRAHSMTYLEGKIIPFVIRGGRFTFAGRGSPYAGTVSAGGRQLTVSTPQAAQLGGTQFRRVTRAALARGAFFHPGYEGKRFFKGGIEDALEELQIQLKEFTFRVSVE